MNTSIFRLAYDCLVETGIENKLLLAKQLWDSCQDDDLVLAPLDLPRVTEAGRPEKPELVPPRQLPRRKLTTPLGLGAMLHAIAHIEFNAINLAADAIYRFQELDADYYRDWAQVASEEAYHFSLLRNRLRDLGFDYGDFPAHNGLWELAVKTAHDPLVRMALVPRVMEARGLDVTPGIMQKFADVGDDESVEILKIILRDEVGHVAYGTRWFRAICKDRGLEPESTYFQLLSEYLGRKIQCPLHKEARMDAGFTTSELETLEAMCR